MKKMQIGHIVDYCIDYNERNKTADEAEQIQQKRKAPKYRLATQQDIDAYFGN